MIPAFNHQDVSALITLLSTPQKIVITTHHRPDGDAMGSSLALYSYLVSKGHSVNVIAPSDYPDFLYWLPNNEAVINFEYNPAKAKQITAEAEIIFCLDFNDPTRVEKYSEYILKARAKKILIDHHLDPENFCDITFSFPLSCATCELIYHLLLKIDGPDAVSKSVAECLYTGIMTDTGSFRFSSMTADTHIVIAHLLIAGASNFLIHEKIYDNFSIDRTRFLGHCIKEKLVVLPEYNTAYIAVTKEELEKYNHRSGDTEGIVNYALGIKDIRFAAFFCERENLIKISFRSKDNFSVKEVAKINFSGGGHRNAAGGRSKESLEATIEKFLNLLPALKDELKSECD